MRTIKQSIKEILLTEGIEPKRELVDSLLYLFNDFCDQVLGEAEQEEKKDGFDMFAIVRNRLRIQQKRHKKALLKGGEK